MVQMSVIIIPIHGKIEDLAFKNVYPSLIAESIAKAKITPILLQFSHRKPNFVEGDPC